MTEPVTEQAARRPGFALPQAYYVDPDIFRRDMDRFVMPHWHCAGHVSMVAEPGQFFTVEIGPESVILVRGQDHEIRALLNVCRHRGSRVCTEAEGKARGSVFACPYHAWTYGLDGALKGARQMGADFDKSTYGLKQIPVAVIEGLIFVAFGDNPPALDQARATLAGSAGIYGWAEAKVACRRMYSVEANWKLAVENYLECYHCGPAHQEYSKFHVFARPSAMNREEDAQIRRRAAAMGIQIAEMDCWGDRALPGQESADAARSALYAGYVSGSEDGGPVAPLMGRFPDYDGGVTFFDIGPTSNFLAYPDHGLIYRFIPRSVQKTDMEVIWLVRGDAVEGRDYHLERLTWMWHVTSLADKRIIEWNQQGVNSRYYEPGPYTPMESGTNRLIEWYLRETAAPLSVPSPVM
jgi:Rieske 2Fe-2S family protein